MKYVNELSELSEIYAQKRNDLLSDNQFLIKRLVPLLEEFVNQRKELDELKDKHDTLIKKVIGLDECEEKDEDDEPLTCCGRCHP